MVVVVVACIVCPKCPNAPLTVHSAADDRHAYGFGALAVSENQLCLTVVGCVQAPPAPCVARSSAAEILTRKLGFALQVGRGAGREAVLTDLLRQRDHLED